MIAWIRKFIRELKLARNSTKAYNHGYVAGYNQSSVDKGFMSQTEADKILMRFGK